MLLLYKVSIKINVTWKLTKGMAEKKSVLRKKDEIEVAAQSWL